MIRYFLNGVECNPSNKNEVDYVFDFTSRKSRELELSVDTLRFVGADMEAIESWLLTNGDYLGMPLTIQYSTGLTIPYFLDFSDGSFEKTERSISVKIIRYRGMDNFFDNAEGLSFGVMNWSNSDFREIDYQVIPEGQIAYFISLLIATFSLAQELAKSLQEISEGISDIVKATTPVGGVPGPDYGAIIVLSIKLLARIAYTLFIVVALIQLVVQIINIIFPFVRQFKCATLKRLIEKGCEHLGFTLQSSLLNSIPDVAVIPVPLREKDPSFFKELFAPMSLAYTNGFPSARDGQLSTLGGIIQFVELLFNAKSKVVGNTFVIEQEMYFEQNPSQNMLLAKNLQAEINTANGINSDEQYKRITAFYQTDPSDINTYDDTLGTVYENSAEIVNTTGINYELIRGNLSLNLPVARGTRKGYLTFVEKACKVLATAIDAFTGGNLQAQIQEREDVMMISIQYFSVPKLVVLSGTKLALNQNDFISCQAIVNGYYYSKFLTNNQKDKFPSMDIAMNEDELFEILEDNYVTLNNGKIAEITRVSWSEKRHVATVDYQVRKTAVNEQIIVINDGF